MTKDGISMGYHFIYLAQRFLTGNMENIEKSHSKRKEDRKTTKIDK